MKVIRKWRWRTARDLRKNVFGAVSWGIALVLSPDRGTDICAEPWAATFRMNTPRGAVACSVNGCLIEFVVREV